MASLAERKREAVDSDEQARSTWGVLDLRQQLVRRSVWQGRWSPAADVDDLLVAIGRRRGFGAAPGDGWSQWRHQHDTRRHPATSVSFWDGDRRLRSVSLAPRYGGGVRQH